jgi:RNA polymerase sporulation-specific sigma factor
MEKESLDSQLTLLDYIKYNWRMLFRSTGSEGLVLSTNLQVQELEKVKDPEQLSDEHLVESVRSGDDEALETLINKYRNFVRAKARSYFLIGADREDIVQEGMIGLYKSIRDYRDDKLTSFKAFAELCITRQIITAIKTATRQKHIPLNSYVSLDKPIYDEDSDRTLLDVICGSRVSDPEELLINQEEFDDIEVKMGEILSDLERKVLMLYLDGRSYQEIAVDLKRHVKSIDNALQRVKRKLERYLEVRDVN